MTDFFVRVRSNRTSQRAMRWRAAFAGVGLALGLAQVALAQTAQPPAPAPHDLAALLLPPISVSEITVEGRPYSVFVVRPFAPPPPHGFPVLVVLDANGTFATAASAAFGRMAFADIAPIIVVGIGYPTGDIKTFLKRRQFDLIGPFTSNGAPPVLDGNPTGGAEEFRLSVVEKVLEQLEQQGQGDKRCRILFGHSLGGLFTVDTLMRHPNMFEGYFASSPSLWLGNSEIFNRIPAPEDWSTSLTAPIRVRLAVGELEAKFSERQVKAFPSLGTMPDPKMVDNTVRLAHLLSGVPKIQLSSEILKNESHNSGMARVISEAITFASECPNRAP
jgi:predicted alpha/beta superfamily hydrolase